MAGTPFLKSWYILKNKILKIMGVYTVYYKRLPFPLEGISANVNWRKNMKRRKRKRGNI
jgi:hypothetical protein